jgi:4'-phosphopantetheinyl transferase
MLNAREREKAANSLYKLPEGEVHVWTGTLDVGAVAIESAEELLSPEERARAGKFVRLEDREKYKVCHGTVRIILGKYTGCPPAELRFKNDDCAKPHLDNAQNSAGLSFNLSHSGKRMLLGVVLKARIGVDLEEIRPDGANLDVANRFFTPRENEELQSLSGKEQIHGFFNCWTRKEAYLKAVGCGLLADPRDCEVSLKPGEEPLIRKQLPAEANGSTWSMFQDGEPGYIIAVAVDRAGVQFEKKTASFENLLHQEKED